MLNSSGTKESSRSRKFSSNSRLWKVPRRAPASSRFLSSLSTQYALSTVPRPGHYLPTSANIYHGHYGIQLNRVPLMTELEAPGPGNTLFPSVKHHAVQDRCIGKQEQQRKWKRNVRAHKLTAISRCQLFSHLTQTHTYMHTAKTEKGPSISLPPKVRNRAGPCQSHVWAGEQSDSTALPSPTAVTFSHSVPSRILHAPMHSHCHSGREWQ